MVALTSKTVSKQNDMAAARAAALRSGYQPVEFVKDYAPAPRARLDMRDILETLPALAWKFELPGGTKLHVCADGTVGFAANQLGADINYATLVQNEVIKLLRERHTDIMTELTGPNRTELIKEVRQALEERGIFGNDPKFIANMAAFLKNPQTASTDETAVKAKAKTDNTFG